MDDAELGEPQPGAGIVRACWIGTGLLVGTSAAAAAVPDTFQRVHSVLSVILFSIGTGAMLWAYALGVTRSREDEITLSGLFFLGEDSAPPEVRKAFRTALAVQVVAVVAAAFIRPFTEVAFGVLAPMYGLGLMAAWGGRHGRFGPRRNKRSS